MGALETLRYTKEQTRIEKQARDYAQFTIARYASLTNDTQVAADFYPRVALTVPEDARVSDRAIFSALLVNDVPKAVDLAEKLPSTTLKQSELARLVLAAEALHSDRSAIALQHLDGPWENTFHAFIARSMIAWVGFEAGDEEAVSLQTNASIGDPALAGIAKVLSAKMQAQRGQTAAALSALETLWDQRVRLAIGVQTEAALLAQAGEAERARQRIRTFTKQIGRNPALDALDDQIMAGIIQPEPAMDAADGAAVAIYAATSAIAAESDDDLAAVYYAIALHLDPDLHAARALLADTLDRAGRSADAISILSDIPETSVYATNAKGQMAWAYRRMGDDSAALQIAVDTLAKSPDRNLQIQLADLLQSLGRDGEAEAAFSQIIDADKADGRYDWRIYFARGAARERLGRWPPAENDLKTAIGLRPDHAGLLNYLGYSWIDRGLNLDEGLALISRALRLDPGNGQITDSLGWAHYKLQNYDQAIFYLERATEILPQDAAILDHLGDVYWQVGRYREAGFQWQRALQYETDPERAEFVEQKLLRGTSSLNVSARSIEAEVR
ncbi:MAG: tetratricopeptide repeat protein [Pseudomonadota bacterium]